MFVCLCKGITEDDVANTARSCHQGGAASLDALLKALDLDCADACGFCSTEHETFLSIAESEWSLLRNPDRVAGF